MLIVAIFVFVVIYAVSVGATEPYFSRQLALRCENCSKGETYRLNGNNQEPGDGHSGFGLALIWPLAYPYMAANYRRSPRLKLANNRIDAYWEDKATTERIERIRRLEMENERAMRELERY